MSPSRLHAEYAAQSARALRRVDTLKTRLYQDLLEPAMRCHVGPGKPMRGRWFCATHRVWFQRPGPVSIRGARPADCPVGDFAAAVWKKVGPL